MVTIVELLDSLDPDLIYVTGTSNISLELPSRYPQSESSNPLQTLHVVEPSYQQQQRHAKPYRPVRAADIRAIANDIFEHRGRGLTFRDLIKGRYKRVDTAKQAQKTLRYHKARANLHTASSMIIPQQYFASKQDAEQAVLYNKKTSTPKVSGVSGKKTPFATPQTEKEEKEKELIAIEDKKADSLVESIEALSNDADGELPTGLHKIKIHLDLPKEYASETYNGRLHYIKSSSAENKVKIIDRVIDGFQVKLLFYPNNKVVILVPSTQRPFPIALDRPDIVTSLLTDFVAQIRREIVCSISDYKNRIVPPIHSPAWQLVEGDLNWDISATLSNYLTLPKMQLIKFNNVIQRIYAKRLANSGKRVIRFEEAHTFKDRPSFDSTIGQVIVDAAKQAKKELVSSLGGAAAGGDNKNL